MQPTALDIERQQRREIAEIRRGEKAYYEAMQSKDPSSLPSGKRLMREVIPALTVAIEKHQQECMDEIKRAGGHRKAHLWAIQMVKAETMAFLTMDTCLRCEMADFRTAKPTSLTMIAKRIGTSCKEHAEVAALAETSGRDPLAHLRAKFGAVNRTTWSRWKRKLGATLLDWPEDVRVGLGAALVRQMVAVAPQHFQLTMLMQRGGRSQLCLALGDVTRAVMDDVEQRRSITLPHYMPMIIRPLDWRYAASLSTPPRGELCAAPHSGTLEGGYVLHRVPMIRTGRDDHTKALASAVSAADLEAINAVQSTGWAVNRYIYDVMSEAWTNGQRLGGLEPGEMMPHARLDDEAFAALNAEDRGEYLRKKAQVHDENARRKGRFNAIVDNLAVARELRDEPVFYYPHAKDFRHRIYPVPVRGPQPQGDDISKSLIHFAEGKPLGETGEFWLCVHAANCAGQDKLTLEERVQWTFANAELIRNCASTPLRSNGWTSTTNPWSFLAACYELSQCWALTEPSEFVSHLPIALDGSCNGIQHLSAMGLDPIGAQATNLTNGPRQDIYTLVADRVRQRIVEDASGGNPEAAAWTTKVTRQTVKRAVMTTPYGVTARGIRDQLLADALVPEGPSQGKLADYMRDCICEALAGTVVAAKAIMGWLQDCAAKLGKAGLPLRWETPSGSLVEQAYHQTTRREIETLCGRLILLQEDGEVGLKPSKQALASAPNIIHSFDAAHLALTVLAGRERGIGHWAMIHDSFGTHAGNTQVLAGVLRQTFADIYSTNWLERLYEGFKAYAPHVQLELPPARGEFNINEVLHADYFFS